MSSLKHLICLANSRKRQERCIAGIEMETGRWIRPVCDHLLPEDGRVPQSVRLVAGREPELLDILAIPLANTGSDFGFETENLSVLPGEWRLIGRAVVENLLRYCQNSPSLLEDGANYIPLPCLQSLPRHQRHTIQLVRTVKFSVEQKQGYRGWVWKGNLETAEGQSLKNANITDPVFVGKLDAGYKPKQEYLVTVSLSLPWRPPDWEGDDPCWKLIAGVIDLPAIAPLPHPTSDILTKTDWEMQRIGWTVEQGRSHLFHTYGKRSRRQLTSLELQEFLYYLRSLPSM